MVVGGEPIVEQALSSWPGEETTWRYAREARQCPDR